MQVIQLQQLRYQGAAVQLTKVSSASVTKPTQQATQYVPEGVSHPRGSSVVCFGVPKKRRSHQQVKTNRIHYLHRAWHHAYYALDVLAKLYDEEGEDFEEELERSGEDLNEEDQIDEEDELDDDDQIKDDK